MNAESESTSLGKMYFPGFRKEETILNKAINMPDFLRKALLSYSNINCVTAIEKFLEPSEVKCSSKTDENSEISRGSVCSEKQYFVFL